MDHEPRFKRGSCRTSFSIGASRRQIILHSTSPLSGLWVVSQVTCRSTRTTYGPHMKTDDLPVPSGTSVGRGLASVTMTWNIVWYYVEGMFGTTISIEELRRSEQYPPKHMFVSPHVSNGVYCVRVWTTTGRSTSPFTWRRLHVCTFSLRAAMPRKNSATQLIFEAKVCIAGVHITVARRRFPVWRWVCGGGF